MKIKDWIRDVRGKQAPDETYVDSAAAPVEPEGPYRARLTKSDHERAVEGIDVTERETVKGEVQVLYRTHCPCGHQWESAELQRFTLCSKCDRAVLAELPKLPP
jgi:hypothetical protein